jgi:hypothetical protein
MPYLIIAYGVGFCATFASLMFVFVSSIAWMDNDRLKLAKSIFLGGIVTLFLSAIFPVTWFALFTIDDHQGM